MSEQPNTLPGPRPKRLLIVGLATLVLGGGASVTAWRLSSARTAAAAPAAGEPGLVAFEPFVVNLADQGTTRYLRLAMRIVVDSAPAARRVQSSDLQMMRVRSAIIDVLTRQTADQLVSADGKAALKQAIAARVEPLFENTRVTDVLFSDFVVQY